MKLTTAEYLKLAEMQDQDELREIKITWVEPGETESSREIAIQPAAVAAGVSRVDGALEGIFGADRVGQEPGAVPGGDPADLSESGADGADRRADVSDAAGRHAARRMFESSETATRFRTSTARRRTS